MARPVKKTPEQWKQEILNAAQDLFLSKGYEAASVSDIMELAGGAKGMFYRFFQSKEEVMYTLGNQLFFENNPFDAVKKREAFTCFKRKPSKPAASSCPYGPFPWPPCTGPWDRPRKSAFPAVRSNGRN